MEYCNSPDRRVMASNCSPAEKIGIACKSFTLILKSFSLNYTATKTSTFTKKCPYVILWTMKYNRIFFDRINFFGGQCTKIKMTLVKHQLTPRSFVVNDFKKVFPQKSPLCMLKSSSFWVFKNPDWRGTVRKKQRGLPGGS